MTVTQNRDVEIRPMRESDLDAVMRIEKQGHAFPWSKGIFEDCIRVGYYCPLFLENSEILGYGVMSMAAGEAHIFNVCVGHNARRRGIGRMLMLHMIDMARQKKVKTAFLEVRPTNTIAITLYEQLGFIEVGTRKNYYPAVNDKREDAMIMAIELNSQADVI